jgi:hypothetical protein
MFVQRIKKHFWKMGHDQLDIDSVHPETDMVETFNLRYMQGLSRHGMCGNSCYSLGTI